MLYSNKMIYQAPKYHSNSFSHFLQLHSNNNNNNNDSLPPTNHLSEDLVQSENTKLEICNENSNSNTSTTSLEVVNESAGKSFTIAAILGLNKSTMRQNCGLDDTSGNIGDYNSDFSSLINFSAHSKLFQKFDNDNKHGFMAQSNNSSMTEHQQQLPLDHCLNDNFNASNSSPYPEHLHKPEFPANYSRNDDRNSPAMRNHMHQHAATNNNNLLNKAFNRERNRLETFTNRNSKSTISLKNKRVRTIFTPEQLERLEAEFERQQYMVGPERLYLAHTLQLTEAQVKVWFQNRRIKWRKHHLEITQQHLAIARQHQIPIAVPSTSRNVSSEESRQSADEQGVSDDGDD